MTKLSWHESGKHFYEAGVDQGAFYPENAPAVSWNGLVSVKETPSGDTKSIVYIDGLRYQNQLSLGSFAASIEAYTYPNEFDEYKGPFGFCYRTQIGNDLDGTDYGYKLHLVYNALATPTAKEYSSINDSSEAIAFSWDISTTPVPLIGSRPTAHIVVESPAYSWVFSDLEDILYGTELTEPRFPSIDEVIQLFENDSILKITDNGDGTWTAESRSGFDNIIQMLDTTTFQISWPSAVFIDSESYTISSL